MTQAIPLIVNPGKQYSLGGMTFLQMTQRLKEECGVSGSLSTVKNQVGELKRLVNWIARAYTGILARHRDWLFLQQPVLFNTTADKASYNYTEVGVWSLRDYKKNSFRCYPLGQPDAELELPWMPWQEFRDTYQFGAYRSLTRRPEAFTLDPQRNLVLGPTPDAVYTINGECWARPTDLVNDDDMPILPGHFHMMIVYRAMMFYGAYESAPEVYANGEREYSIMFAQLTADQLPPICFGGPLA
jgi:hypothetical protein